MEGQHTSGSWVGDVSSISQSFQISRAANGLGDAAGESAVSVEHSDTHSGHSITVYQQLVAKIADAS